MMLQIRYKDGHTIPYYLRLSLDFYSCSKFGHFNFLPQYSKIITHNRPITLSYIIRVINGMVK
jgi:hypothetical protein